MLSPIWEEAYLQFWGASQVISSTARTPPPPRALGFSQLTSESWESPNLSGSKDLPRGMVSADTQEQVTKVLSLLDS